MLNQSFSAENFEKIFNLLNRKGEIKRDFLPELYVSKSIEIKGLRVELKDLRVQYRAGIIDKDEYNEKKEEGELKIKNLTREKEVIIYNHLKEISNKVNKDCKLFQFEVGERKGKPTYEIDKNDEAQFYALKQLQYNIRKTFGVKQADRYSILKQLKHLLEDGLPKIIIRTDIKAFYESIPQGILKDRIENSTLLTYQSKQFISSILDEFESLRPDKDISPNIGIPRGVGISAYLAELYMKDVDQRIKSIKNVSYYARYVDDIIVVFTPSSKYENYNYLADITTVVEQCHLQLNVDKTTCDFINRADENEQKVEISFLGYKFAISHRKERVKLSVHLSDAKKERYKTRVRQSIEDYNTSSKTNERQARKLLYKRLWFLTGNTNLINSKKGIKTGIYYSNSLLEKSEAEVELRKLDNYLISLFMRIQPYNQLCFDLDKFKLHLRRKFSFIAGFNELRFHSFNKDDFQKIKRIWDED